MIAFHVRARRDAFVLDFGARSEARALAVEGPSGAGKTTLLLALAGLAPATSVRFQINDDVIVDTEAGCSPPPHRRRIGFIFQDARLFPHLTVADNLAFGARYAPRPIAVEAALDLVDLRGFGHRWPQSLSGGEARRVAIARALCMDPRILFLDEPFAGLDAERRSALTPYLKRLRDETTIPLILVSHDPRDIAALAQDRVGLRDGRSASVARPPLR